MVVDQLREKSKKFNRTLGELFRYGLVGVITNLSGYVIYLLITHLGGDPKVSVSILYPIGAVLGFYGNRQWTFSYKEEFFKTSVRYFFVHVAGYALNITILYLFVDRFGYPHQLIQILAVILVAAFLFVMFKRFVFRGARVKLIGDRL